MPRSLLPAFLLLALFVSVASAADRIPVIIDTDIGSDIDDAFALALAIASPEFELVGVTTCAGDTTIRAKMALRMLHAAGQPKVPVAAGAQPQPKSDITGQYHYYYHPAVLYNRAGKPQKETAVEFLTATLKERKDKVTIVAVGPLTNIARFIKEQPELAKEKIERIVIMGGALERNYKGEMKPELEWNFKLDPAAAQAVLASKLPLAVVPLDATWNLRLEKDAREKFFGKQSLLTQQVQTMYQMWNEDTPVLFDPLAVAVVVDDKLCTWENLKLGVDDTGRMQSFEAGAPNARVAMKCDSKKFIDWYVAKVNAFGETKTPRPLKNESKIIEDNRFPNRVHAFEDFETDIEKRWWLSGRLLEEGAPQGKRAYRSQLTLDFDDLQGQLDTMYSAVVFNPVPGPPMGERTRLKFRYYLEGTDELRVQLYSLSNGYHRYLSLKGLPKEKWQDATVDMTAMRRPDGSGGPLKNERIDDIQFYVGPHARVRIDEMILYDAGDEGEKRPYPQRLLFTGWFDSGKQGNEWPGEFAIVEHEKPRSFKAAKSIVKTEGEPQVLVVGLRGMRPLTAGVKLDLAYRLEGKLEGTPGVALVNSKDGQRIEAKLADAKSGEWSRATLDFPQKNTGPAAVDQIVFQLPAGVTLWIDDVLLYEPGK